MKVDCFIYLIVRKLRLSHQTRASKCKCYRSVPLKIEHDHQTYFSITVKVRPITILIRQTTHITVNNERKNTLLILYNIIMIIMQRNRFNYNISLKWKKYILFLHAVISPVSDRKTKRLKNCWKKLTWGKQF